MHAIEFSHSSIPVVDEADVVVVGGGPAGIAAAIAAARKKLKVIIIEKTSFCGGVAGMGLPIQGLEHTDGTLLVRGIAWELYRNLVARGGAFPTLIPCELHNPYAIIDPDQCILGIQNLLDAEQVTVWYHSHFLHVVKSNEKRMSLGIIGGKGGLHAICGSYWIDATGDGDVAADMGIPFVVGRDEDGVPQSATLNFTIAHVDLEKLGTAFETDGITLFDTHPLLDRKKIIKGMPHIMVGMRNLIERISREEHVEIPSDYVCYVSGVQPGTVTINMTHVPHAMGHTLLGLSEAEQQGRRQIDSVYSFFKKYVPGFDDSTISRIASHIGIRESRHIEGMYTLSAEDVIEGRFHEDTIALGGYPIDIHNPEKGDVYLQRVPPYGIPYRCMVPKHVENLLFTGRALSADHIALASCRLIASCMAMGEAAGTAAAQACRFGTTVQDVSIRMLQSDLEKNGAIIRATRKE